MSYPEADALAALVAPALDGVGAAVLEGYRLSAINAVEEFCRQSFDVKEATYAVDGMGADVLYTPARVVEITSLLVRGVEQLGGNEPLTIGAGSAVLLLDDRRDRIRWRGYGRNYYERTMQDLEGFHPTWPLGAGSVVLSGRWGWEEVPDEVAHALAQDMRTQHAHADSPLAQSVEEFRALGIKSISQGNLAVTLDAASGLSPAAMRYLSADFIWAGGAPGFLV